MSNKYLLFNRYLISLIPISLIFSIFVADLIISLTSIFFIFYCLVKKNYSIFNVIEFKIFILFYFLLIVGSLNSDFTIYSLKKVLPYIRFGLFIILVKYLIKNDNKFLIFFLNSLLISVLILFIGLIFQILSIGPFKISIWNNRYSSFFFDELIMGSYLIKILPISMALLFMFKKKKLIYFTVLVISVMILVSGERSAILSLIILLSFIFIFTNLINLKKKIIGIIILLFSISTTFFLNDNLKFRVIDKTLYQLRIIEPDRDYVELKYSDKPEKYTAIAREEFFLPLKYYLLFNSGLKIFSDHILFGSGLKTFRILCKKDEYYLKKNYLAFKDKPDDYYEGFTGVDGCSTHPHNYYIQLLSETGLLTTLIVFFVFCLSIFNYFKTNLFEKKIIFLSIFINLFPLITTGSFFNNFICILIYLPICFLDIKKKNSD